MREYTWNPGLSFSQTVNTQTLSYVTYVYTHVGTSPDDSLISAVLHPTSARQPLSKGHTVPQEGSSRPCGLGSFPPWQRTPSPSFASTLSNSNLFFLKNSRRKPQRVLHTISPGLILSRCMVLLPSPVYPAHLLTLCLSISSVSLS